MNCLARASTIIAGRWSRRICGAPGPRLPRALPECAAEATRGVGNGPCLGQPLRAAPLAGRKDGRRGHLLIGTAQYEGGPIAFSNSSGVLVSSCPCYFEEKEKILLKDSKDTRTLLDFQNHWGPSFVLWLPNKRESLLTASTHKDARTARAFQKAVGLHWAHGAVHSTRATAWASVRFGVSQSAA